VKAGRIYTCGGLLESIHLTSMSVQYLLNLFVDFPMTKFMASESKEVIHGPRKAEVY
jgi:hypothetical protein